MTDDRRGRPCLAGAVHCERATFQIPIAPGTVDADFVLQLMSGGENLLALREAKRWL